MAIVKKYEFYKKCLLVLFSVNIFFIICGVVALIQYFKSHDPTVLQLVAVGAGTFVFGLLIPYVLISRFVKAVEEMRKQTQELIASWVAGWLETFRNHEGEAVKDPVFWINIALLSIEVFGENLSHPMAKVFVEFAPLIKQELTQQAKPKKRSRKKETA